jgi:hypothetical protein
MDKKYFDVAVATPINQKPRALFCHVNI